MIVLLRQVRSNVQSNLRKSEPQYAKIRSLLQTRNFTLLKAAKMQPTVPNVPHNRLSDMPKYMMLLLPLSSDGAVMTPTCWSNLVQNTYILTITIFMP